MRNNPIRTPGTRNARCTILHVDINCLRPWQAFALGLCFATVSEYTSAFPICSRCQHRGKNVHVTAGKIKVRVSSPLERSFASLVTFPFRVFRVVARLSFRVIILENQNGKLNERERMFAQLRKVTHVVVRSGELLLRRAELKHCHSLFMFALARPPERRTRGELLRVCLRCERAVTKECHGKREKWRMDNRFVSFSKGNMPMKVPGLKKKKTKE